MTLSAAELSRHSLAAPTGLAVIKIGGSVIRSSKLNGWLDVIAAAARPVVVVPGGGALADEVRAAQAALGFGDRAAHRMALLAMDQLAWAVAGMRAGTAEQARGSERRGDCGCMGAHFSVPP